MSVTPKTDVVRLVVNVQPHLDSSGHNTHHNNIQLIVRLLRIIKNILDVVVRGKMNGDEIIICELSGKMSKQKSNSLNKIIK